MLLFIKDNFLLSEPGYYYKKDLETSKALAINLTVPNGNLEIIFSWRSRFRYLQLFPFLFVNSHI